MKKQANSFLFAFTKSFKENVPDGDAYAILFQFCREYLDEMKFPGDSLPRRHLPFQLTKLLDNYLCRECEKDQMPQMRWAYQIFGNSYNPHDPMLEHDFYSILKRAYMHEKCDLQTVQLYFREQLDSLWWGQHHFPESCGITEEFEYYVRLYQTYFEWQNNDRNGDFYELFRKEGLAFEGVPVIYYKE